MKLGIVRTMGVCMLGVTFAVLLAGCGGPDTEDQTLSEARQTLEDAGVQEGNITVKGPEARSADPDELYVCDQEPDSANPEDSVLLEVATTCPNEDDGKKKRRSFGKKRR